MKIKKFDNLIIGNRYYIEKLSIGGFCHFDMEIKVNNKTSNRIKFTWINEVNDVVFWASLDRKFDCLVDIIINKDA